VHGGRPARFHPDRQAHQVTVTTLPLRSFDVARIVAISLVAAQHLLTISDYKPPLLLGCLGVGQLGVTIFCGLSGYFSLRSSRTSNLDWARRRLIRIFIPYWITLVAIFAANAVVRYKPVTLGLIVSEFLGTALFTHAASLVGVHVWFISLILICYAIALVVRWKPKSMWLFLLAVIAAAWLWDPLVACHVLSFVAGCALGKGRLPTVALIAAFSLAGVGLGNCFFAYPLAAMAILALCIASSAASPSWLARASELTYEFFLVHGPIYLGLARYAHLGLPANLVLGTLLAIAAAIVLRGASFAAVQCTALLWQRAFFRRIRQAFR
jgi:peptidoglycan/LPS O-acetylase OafA/YrhL